ncbi:hypothetical protein ACFLSA_04720 [Bacteroidota bacterium]
MNTQKLHDHSDMALEILEKLRPGSNKELIRTLHDIQTIFYLGKYYANKIAGATHLAMYRETNEKNTRKNL